MHCIPTLHTHQKNSFALCQYSMHTPCTPILCMGTPRTPILRMHHPIHIVIFCALPILHHASPNLSAHTHAPFFSRITNYAPRNAKFKCAHPCTIIFRALPILHHAVPNLSAHSAIKTGDFSKIFLTFTMDILQHVYL
jgi:hypothetical protein